MHPNDGYDLGLFTKTHHVAWAFGIATKDFIEGQQGAAREAWLDLLNECPTATLRMNAKQWESIGSPEHAICLMDGERLLINGLAEAPH